MLDAHTALPASGMALFFLLGLRHGIEPDHIAAIEQAGRALTPGEILALAQASVASLNLSTIYRQLSALQDEARIVKVLLPGQAARFEAACADDDHGAQQVLRGKVALPEGLKPRQVTVQVLDRAGGRPLGMRVLLVGK